MMNDVEKIKMLAETLGESEDSLTLDTTLDSLENWDLMAQLSLIVLFDRKFDKALSTDQIKSFKTIEDIVKVMN